MSCKVFSNFQVVKLSTDVKLQFGLFNDCWLCRRCAEIKITQLLSDEAVTAILTFVERVGHRIANIKCLVDLIDY